MENSAFQETREKLINDSATKRTIYKDGIGSYLKIGLLNIRSIINKFNIIYDLIVEGLDVFVVTETWHGSSDDVSVKLATPPGFNHVDFLRRNDPWHGGVIIFLRSCFKYEIHELPPLKYIEAIVVRFFIGGIELVLLALYRPGSLPVSPVFFQ